MAQTIKWGIIGPGDIARQFAHDLPLVSHPCEVSAILAHSKEGADEFVAEFGQLQVHYELEDFIAAGGFDIVYIASPHGLHYKQALACLENGIPVLCEKPATLNQKDFEHLSRVSRENNVFFMEAMWIRFVPSIRHLMSIINNGKIGNIISIKASLGFKAPYEPSNRFFNPKLGGGSLADIGIYPIFLAYLFLGMPATIKAIGTLTDEGVDETCSMLFHYKSGQHAVLESSIMSEMNLPAEICGDKGTVRLLSPWFEKSNGIELHVFDEGKIIYPCSWNGHGLQFEAEEAVKCLQEKKYESSILPHAFSLAMQKIMDEIKEQINVHHPVPQV